MTCHPLHGGRQVLGHMKSGSRHSPFLHNCWTPRTGKLERLLTMAPGWELRPEASLNFSLGSGCRTPDARRAAAPRDRWSHRHGCGSHTTPIRPWVRAVCGQATFLSGRQRRGDLPVCKAAVDVLGRH